MNIKLVSRIFRSVDDYIEIPFTPPDLSPPPLKKKKCSKFNVIVHPLSEYVLIHNFHGIHGFR